jgi:hypothetical protein
MSGATAIGAAGAVSRGAGLGGASRRTVDNLRATADPAITDDVTDGYHIGSKWCRADTGEEWYCIDAMDGAAVWVPRFGQFGAMRRQFYTQIDCITNPPSANGLVLLMGDFAANAAGTGAAFTAITGLTGVFGVWSLDMGTTTTGYVSLMNSANVTNLNIRFGEGRAKFQAKGAIHVLSDGTNTFTSRIGFLDTNFGESADGAFFRYTHGVNSGEWQAVTRSNNTETATDTNVAVVADAFKRFRIEVNAAGTSVAFYIDDVLVATNTANIPTGVGRDVGYGAMGLKSAGTAATSAWYLDFMEVEYNFTTAR